MRRLLYYWWVNSLFETSLKCKAFFYIENYTEPICKIITIIKMFVFFPIANDHLSLLWNHRKKCLIDQFSGFFWFAFHWIYCRQKMCDLFVFFFSNYHNSIKETADLILTLNKIGKQNKCTRPINPFWIHDQDFVLGNNDLIWIETHNLCQETSEVSCFKYKIQGGNCNRVLSASLFNST